MANGYWIVPSKYKNTRVMGEDTLEVKSVSEIQDSSEIRKKEIYVHPLNGYDILHSRMKNVTYKSFFDAFLDFYYYLYDYAFILNGLYDLSWYDGDYSRFLERVDNILQLLKIKFPVDFTKYVNAVEGVTDLNKEYEWIQKYIESIVIQKNLAGTIKAYNLSFKLINCVGNFFIAEEMPVQEIITSFSSKLLRIIDKLSISSVIPNASGSSYPDSRGLAGILDKNIVITDFYKYDSGLIFDQQIGDEKIKFDLSLSTSSVKSNILLDISLDRIYKHTNTFKTNSCLMDNEFLKTLELISKTIKRISDTVYIGSQLTLVAKKNGRYTNTINSLYTHPNIEAKFQVFPENLNLGNEISYVKIGSGTLPNSIWVGYDDPLLQPSQYPTDIANPVFTTYLTNYEKFVENGYTCITCVIHSILFKNKTIMGNINIAGSTVNNNSVAVSTISLPHKSIASKYKFIFRIFLNPENFSDFPNDFINFTYQNDSNNRTFITVSSQITNISTVDGTEVRFSKSNNSSLPVPLLEQKIYYIRRVYIDSSVYFYLFDTYEHAINRDSFEGIINLSGGSGSYYILFATNLYDRYIIITEDYNKITQEFETQTVLARKSNDNYLILYNEDEFVDAFNDKNYSIDLNYFPNAKNNIIAILPILDGNGNPKKTKSGKYIYSEVNKQQGKISLRLKIDPNSIFYNNTTTRNYFVSIDSTYSINTISESSDYDFSDEVKASVVKIQEVGVFDSTDKLIAYGTFPPIIYDSKNYHLSLNLLIEK